MKYIDPATLPDGTVVETTSGVLRFKDRYGWVTNRPSVGVGRTIPWRNAIVRTFTPDPTPDQEIPRDEWKSIPAGSRVKIIEKNGDEHTVTTGHPGRYNVFSAPGRSYLFTVVDRVYRLDQPDQPDPDAKVIEAVEEAVPVGEWDGRVVLDRLRAAGFDVVRTETTE